MVLSVLQEYNVTPPQLSTMVASVLFEYEVTPPQLSTMVVSVLYEYEVIPLQLSTMVGSVLKIAGPPPKATMVSEMVQFTPALPSVCL